MNNLPNSLKNALFWDYIPAKSQDELNSFELDKIKSQNNMNLIQENLFKNKQDVSSLIEEYSNIISNVANSTGINKALEIKQTRASDIFLVLDMMDTWINKEADNLYYPFNKENFTTFLSQLLLQENLDKEDCFAISFVSIVRPDLFNDACQKNNALFTSVNANLTTESRQDKEKKRFSPNIEFIEDWIDWLKENQNKDKSLLLYEFDEKIKNEIIKTKGVGELAKNYWLEDYLLPALTKLSRDNQQLLINHWPKTQILTFNNPVKALSSRDFWISIREMDYLDRKFFMESTLSTIINTEEWSHQQRFEMLSPMILYVKKYPSLVKERLKLWIKWGGNLEEEVLVKTPNEEDFFANKQTAKEWLEKNTQLSINEMLPNSTFVTNNTSQTTKKFKP